MAFSVSPWLRARWGRRPPVVECRFGLARGDGFDEAVGVVPHPPACVGQGRLARVYAHLVRELWSPTKHTVTPKSFKNAIAKFNDVFGGHDQHDSQVRGGTAKLGEAPRFGAPGSPDPGVDGGRVTQEGGLKR